MTKKTEELTTTTQRHKKFVLIGTIFYSIALILTVLVIILLLKYQLRFVGPIPTFALMFIPFIAGNWFYFFASEIPSKRKKAFIGNSISTVLFLIATGIAMAFISPTVS